MANNKTKQARDRLLSLLKGREPLSIEEVYTRCECDFDALAGALSSLIEKEEVRIGRLKTRAGWLIGESAGHEPAGSAAWQTGRGQMRHTFPKILKELKKYAPAEEAGLQEQADLEQLKAVSDLLSDDQPRSKSEIIAATGMEDLHPSVWRQLPQLPDGRYTLPDSQGAWDALATYLEERPRRLSDLLRLFRKHKKITARLASDSIQEPFVRLPRAMITTQSTEEGKQELERRNQLKACRETLDTLSNPFFIPEQLGLNHKLFQGLADSYTVPVEFDGIKYHCLRREFPGEDLVEQLGEISGRYFAPPYAANAPAFLREHSVGEREAAGLLGLEQEALSEVLLTGQLEPFVLDDHVRFWRSDLEALKKDGARLRDLARNYEKFTLPEAAAFLGLTTAQFRRLLEEESLAPASQAENQREAYLFRRQDLERLRERLPAILSRWSAAKSKDQGPENLPGEGRYPAKKKPVRRKETPPPAPENLTLDDFQIKASKALGEARSVIVSAPTGNGKTLVAEMLAKNLMAEGRGMVYTSPLKALSNQKYRDFKELFGEDRVGLVTGDISINPGAPLLIMTTEIFRNWCLSEPDQLKKTAYVVFDEIHYLDDADRGTTWEESILFAPPHIKILGLSATVPNIEEMADWISSVRGEQVVTVQENRRHVPLTIRWILPSGRIVEEEAARSEVEDLAEYLKALRNKRRWIEE